MWKILVVDDDSDALILTRTILSDYTFEGKGLDLLFADSALEAKKLLVEHCDIAFILLDVVMETNHAGLHLVRYIREELNNSRIWIMLRTGYPGEAPEPMVIQKFDINDYEIKTDLTPAKLLSKLTIGLRSYSTLVRLQQLEDKLQENFDKTKSLLGTMTEGVALNEIVYDEQGEMIDYRVIEVNEAYYSVANLENTVVIGQLATNLYGMSQDTIKLFWNKHRTLNKTAYSEYRNPNSNKWFYVSTSPFVKGRFVTVFFDITSIKKVEQKLKDSEEQHKLILQTAMDGFWRVDMQGKLLEVNETYCRMSGYSEQELLNMSIADIDANEKPFEILTHIKKIEEQGEDRFETSHRRKDGSVFYVENSVQYKAINNGYMVVFLRDITEQKKTSLALSVAKEKAEESEQKYKMIFEATGTSNSLFNRNCCLILQNSISRKELGHTEDDAIGLSVFELFGETLGQQIYERMMHVFATGISETFETKFNLPTGEKWFKSSYQPVINQHEEIVAIQIVSQDISDIKQAEQELLTAKEKAEISEEKYKIALVDLNKAQTVAKVGSWKWLIQENQLIWSKEMYAIFEIDEKSFRGDLAEIIQNCIHPDDKEKVDASNNSAIEKGVPVPLEYRIITPNGKIKVVWGEVGELVYGKNSKPAILTGIVQDITERKLAEQALMESDTKHSAMIENIADVIGIMGIDGIMKYKSPNITKWFGWLPEDLDGANGWDNVHPDDIERIQEEFNELILTDKAYKTFEYRYKCKDGSYKWIELTASNQLSNPLIDGILLNYHDISEREKIEQQLVESEERYKLAFDTSPDAININKIDGTYVDINQGFTILTGYTRQDVIGLSSLNIHIWNNEADRENLITTLFKHGKVENLEAEFRRKDGSVTTALMSANFISLYNEPHILSITRDISERKRVELALKESEEKFSKAFYSSTAAMAITRLSDGNILDVNNQALKLLGFERNELIGHTGVELNLWLNNSEREGVFNQLVKYNTFEETEVWLRTKQEKQILARFSAQSIFIGNEKCMLSIFIDVTDRKRIELELIAAKEKAEGSDRLKTAFLQNMSHEIRTPMNAIIGFSELLVKFYNNRPKLEHFTGIIIQRSNDLLEIINEILDIAKIESGQLQLHNEKCELKKLFAELETLFLGYKKRYNKTSIELILNVQIDAKASTIITDAIKLKQIFINLLGNAFKFTEKGKIEAGCRYDNDNKLLFYVSDTGIGIPKEKQEIIFERFAQIDHGTARLYGGTGLGLSIVKGLLDLMGGSICLDSQSGVGTTFYFSFPYECADIKLDEGTLKKETNEIPFSNGTVLIVEDDKYNADYLKEVLIDSGLILLHAIKGKEAIAFINENKVDLILMDIRLPDMSGYDVIKEIKKTKPEMKIIAQTAYASNLDREKALEAGCDDYMSKPIKPDVLISKVRNYLSEKS